MKASFLLPVFALILTTPSSADFDHPEIHPGAPMSLEGLSLGAVEAVVEHADELEELMSHGDQVLAVGAIQNVEAQSFEVLVGECTIDPAHICFAKAKLTIHRGYVSGTGAYDHAAVEEVAQDARVAGELNNTTRELVTALGHVIDAVREFAARGNRLTLATTQFMHPKFSRYVIQNTACGYLPSGACIGGARLSVFAHTEFLGTFPKTTYSTSLVLIK